MDTKIMRFTNFFRKDRVRKFIAFVDYVLVVGYFMNIELPLIPDIICSIIYIFVVIVSLSVYMNDIFDRIYERNKGKFVKNIFREVKIIGKEIMMYIPIEILSIFIVNILNFPQAENQIAIEETFYESPIFNVIICVIIGTIIEEIICRYLLHKFIKNKILYILISTFVFAALHVSNDQNAFYTIWYYVIDPLYWGYRYYKTKDILVTISMHCFNNFIATLLF